MVARESPEWNLPPAIDDLVLRIDPRRALISFAEFPWTQSRPRRGKEKCPAKTATLAWRNYWTSRA